MNNRIPLLLPEYLEKSKRTSASILGWDPQSLREDLRKLGWTGGDVEDAVTYWSSLPRAPPQGTPSGWRRDLTMECVEPNPGPTLAEILAGLRTKLAADADAFEDDIKQFEAKIREAYPNIRTPSDIQVGQFLQEHENVVNTIFKDDATNVKKFIQELLPKAPPPFLQGTAPPQVSLAGPSTGGLGGLNTVVPLSQFVVDSRSQHHCWGNCGITTATLVDREPEISLLANKFYELWCNMAALRRANAQVQNTSTVQNTPTAQNTPTEQSQNSPTKQSSPIKQNTTMEFAKPNISQLKEKIGLIGPFSSPGIGKTTFCTQFARAFVTQPGNIKRFLDQHGTQNAQLFVALLKQIVDHSLTIGIDFERLGSFFPNTATLTDITTIVSKLMLLFGLQKYEGYAISYGGHLFDVPSGSAADLLATIHHVKPDGTFSYPPCKAFFLDVGQNWVPQTVLSFLRRISALNPFCAQNHCPLYTGVVPYIVFFDEIDKLNVEPMKDVLRVMRDLIHDGLIFPLAAGNLLDLFAEATRVSSFVHSPFFLDPFLDLDAFLHHLEVNCKVRPPTYELTGKETEASGTSYEIYKDEHGYTILPAVLWYDVISCFFCSGGVWRFVAHIGELLVDILNLRVPFIRAFAEKAQVYYNEKFGWLRRAHQTCSSLVQHLCLLALFGTPLDRTWRLFPATLLPDDPDDPSVDKWMKTTVTEAEAQGIIYTYYPLKTSVNGRDATQIVCVVIPEVILSILREELRNVDLALHLPGFDRNPWEIATLSRFGTMKSSLHGLVATNPADKERDLEVEIMSFIYGRAQQLKLYVTSVTLVDIIPDVPEEFAKYCVSPTGLVIFKHIVPPKSGSQYEGAAVAQLLELPKTGCGVNVKGPAAHADAFLTYTVAQQPGLFGFDIKGSKPESITVKQLRDEYVKIKYNSYLKCRCDKVIAVRPKIRAKITNAKFLLNLQNVFLDIDSHNESMNISTLFDQDTSTDNEQNDAHYSEVDPANLPIEVDLNEVVRINRVAVASTSNYWLSDGHSIIPCCEYFFLAAYDNLKDLFSLLKRNENAAKERQSKKQKMDDTTKEQRIDNASKKQKIDKSNDF